MEKEALQFIQENDAIQRINETLNEELNALALVPAGASVVDFEKHLECRRRFRGLLKTNNITDFCRYTLDEARPDESHCFVDAEGMQAQVVFDLGNRALPQHGEHRGVLTLQKTAPFTALLEANGKEMPQRKIAEWLEDWREYMTAEDSAGNEMKMAAAIAAVRRIEVSETAETTSEERSYGGKRGRLEEVSVNARDNPLPAFLSFYTEPYHGLYARHFTLRLSMMQTPSGPQFVLRIVRLEHAEEEMAQEFKALLRNKLDTGDRDINIPITVGTFSM